MVPNLITRVGATTMIGSRAQGSSPHLWSVGVRIAVRGASRIIDSGGMCQPLACLGEGGAHLSYLDSIEVPHQPLVSARKILAPTA